MMLLLRQFGQGIVDAMRIPDALITIAMDGQLRWLNAKCFVLNGLLWLGTILIYSAVVSVLFSYNSNDVNTEADQGPAHESDSLSAVGYLLQAIVTILHLGMDLMHNFWLMFIYIATLVLTTFWV